MGYSLLFSVIFPVWAFLCAQGYFLGFVAIGRLDETRVFDTSFGTAKYAAYIITYIFIFGGFLYLLLPAIPRVCYRLLVVVLAGFCIVATASTLITTSFLGFQELISPEWISTSTVQRLESCGWCCANTTNRQVGSACPCLLAMNHTHYKCFEEENYRLCGQATLKCGVCNRYPEDSIFIANQCVLFVTFLLYLGFFGGWLFFRVRAFREQAQKTK